jgi:hypothetical protein
MLFMKERPRLMRDYCNAYEKELGKGQNNLFVRP